MCVPPLILTRFGPEDRTLASCAPYVDLSIPILASISQNGVLAGREDCGAFLRASFLAWRRNIRMASSCLVGRERNGLRGAVLVEGGSAFGRSFLAALTMLPRKELPGRFLLLDMVIQVWYLGVDGGWMMDQWIY